MRLELQALWSERDQQKGKMRLHDLSIAPNASRFTKILQIKIQ